MKTELVAAVTRAVNQMNGDCNVEAVGRIMEAARQPVSKLWIVGENLPYGRYLLHQDPAGKFNIQIMIYSPDYTGSIHSHESWGMLFGIKGGLHSWDYLMSDQAKLKMIRQNFIGAGACQSFSPKSDYHKVASPNRGKQSVTLHIYGEGFDLEVGNYYDENSVKTTAPRSPWGDPQVIKDNLVLI